MRKAFKFYRSYWEVAQELNDKDRLKFLDAILKRQFLGEQSELDGMSKFAMLSQKHSIDLQVDGYLSQWYKKHPNEDPWQGVIQDPIKDPTIQVEEKEKEEVKEKVNSMSIPPLFTDVLEHCMKEKIDIDVNKWFNFYESKGWLVGKTKMKNWKASIRTWEKKEVRVHKELTPYIPPKIFE